MKTSLIALLILSISFPAYAGVEDVLIKKVMDDKVMVVRTNGEMYLIEKGVGCLSLWRYEGKRIYIHSPGIFLGVGSSLLLPDDGQQCRIWNSEPLGPESAQSVSKPSRSPSSDFIIELAHNDETFFINEKVFKAQTYCIGWEKGDRVMFLNGSPNGACASATLYNNNKREKCDVWCE